jgi:hypothetical protein
MLNDWDMAKKQHDTPGARQKGRTVRQATVTYMSLCVLTSVQGTWAFMSYRVLQDPAGVMEARDDRESIIWVAIYEMLRFMPHSLAADVRFFTEYFINLTHITS